MERLTERLNDELNGIWVKDHDYISAAKKLAEYEDLGLTPEQIREMDRAYSEQAKEFGKYKSTKEKGLLLKLPCKIGDVVYTNISMQGWYFRKENRPYEAKVVFIGINGADNYMNIDYGNGHMFQFNFSDIGKTVFFTKSEAKAAL